MCADADAGADPTVDGDGDVLCGGSAIGVLNGDGVGEDEVFAELEIVKGLVVIEACDVGVEGPVEGARLLGGIKERVAIQGEHGEERTERRGGDACTSRDGR